MSFCTKSLRPNALKDFMQTNIELLMRRRIKKIYLI